MPVKPPDYQLRLNLDLPDDADRDKAVLSTDDIRIRAEAARAQLEGGQNWKRDSQNNPKPPVWLQEYFQLLEGGWPWRVAVYIAWKATPKKYRWPESQEELATNVLGLSSDRVIATWRAKNPGIDAMVQDVGSARVLDRLNDSIEAMLEVAAQPNYKGRGDRELHFKLAGVLAEQIDINDKSGMPDLSKLPWDEKLKLAGLDTPEKIAAYKDELAKAHPPTAEAASSHLAAQNGESDEVSE